MGRVAGTARPYRPVFPDMPQRILKDPQRDHAERTGNGHDGRPLRNSGRGEDLVCPLRKHRHIERPLDDKKCESQEDDIDADRNHLLPLLSEKKYPETFRLIRFYDEEDEREFIFLTNAKHISAINVANLYKKRWLVELFFKWLKQHLKIKRFWGTTENAVRIQISVAIITYCLVAIVQHDMKLNRSTYEVLQILSISLTDKTHLRDLFDKTNFKDVKEQFNPLIPGLFN